MNFSTLVLLSLLSRYAANPSASDAFWDNRWQQVNTTADQLLAQNEAITTSTTQGANEKIWNRVFLAKLGRNDLTLTAQQVADLQSVANQ